MRVRRATRLPPLPIFPAGAIVGTIQPRVTEASSPPGHPGVNRDDSRYEATPAGSCTPGGGRASRLARSIREKEDWACGQRVGQGSLRADRIAMAVVASLTKPIVKEEVARPDPFRGRGRPPMRVCWRLRAASSRCLTEAKGLGFFPDTPKRRLTHPGWLVASGLVAILVLATFVPATARFEESLGLQLPQQEVEAPDFLLPDLAGKKIRLKDFRGKVVLLNFFATWCIPCRIEMPALEWLHRTYKDKGLVVLAVDIQEGARTVRAFTQELKLSFPALLDEDGSVAYTYGIRPVPATYLIGRDGKILWRAFGAREWDSSEARQYFSSLMDGRKR